MRDRSLYSIEPLGQHKRAAFSCGKTLLDSYFVERASRDARELLSAVFVLVSEEYPESVLGYYTLSSQEIEMDDLPQLLVKKLGKYKRVPATLLGRLAVDLRYQGRGLGELLLIDALKRALEATQEVASFAVVVDPLDKEAAVFYAKFGFLPLTGSRMFLPMKSVEQLFGSLPNPTE